MIIILTVLRYLELTSFEVQLCLKLVKLEDVLVKLEDVLFTLKDVLVKLEDKQTCDLCLHKVYEYARMLYVNKCQNKVY